MEMTCRNDFERLQGGLTYIRKNVRPAYVKQDQKIQLASAELQKWLSIRFSACNGTKQSTCSGFWFDYGLSFFSAFLHG
jgi:hypothetical protein